MKILGGIKDYAVKLLSVIKGEELQIMANLTDADQVDLVNMGLYQRKFHSKYIPEKVDMYLRVSISQQGMGRLGMEKIAQTPEVANPGGQSFGDWVAAEEVNNAGDSGNRRL